MACRISGVIGVIGFLAASAGAAQDVPNPQAMQMQVQQIVQQRPREAEAAARAFLMLVAPERVKGLDSLREQINRVYNQPIVVVDPVSEPPAQDQYWSATCLSNGVRTQSPGHPQADRDPHLAALRSRGPAARAGDC